MVTDQFEEYDSWLERANCTSVNDKRVWYRTYDSPVTVSAPVDGIGAA